MSEEAPVQNCICTGLKEARHTKTGENTAELAARKWCVQVVHLVLVLQDTCPNAEHVMRRCGQNYTQRSHISSLQPANHVSLIQQDEYTWMRPIFFWSVLSKHKISCTGPTQIQDNHTNDHSTVRKMLSDVVLGRLVSVKLTSYRQLCGNSKHRPLHTKFTNGL
jgi:hypothetical protein